MIPAGAARRRRGEWLGTVTAVVVLAAYWVMAVSASRGKSCVYDEIAHLTAGVSHWRTGDYRLNPEQGALPQRVAAWPVAWGPFVFPTLDQDAWRRSDEFALGNEFFHELGNDVDAMLLRGRSMNAALASAAGLLVFFWSRRLWGLAGGLLSTVVFAFCPTFLAHGALVTSDVAVATTLTASVVAEWTMLHRLSARTWLLGTLALAGLFLSKASATLVLPMIAALVAVRLVRGEDLAAPLLGGRVLRGRWRQLVAIALALLGQALIVVVAIWAAFGFRFSPFRDATPGVDRPVERWESLERQGQGPIGAILFAREHRLLPEAYLWGLAYASRHAQGRHAFAAGQYAREGWWWFFPYAFAIKTPLPVLLLLVLGALGWRRGASPPRPPPPGGLYRSTPLVVLVTIWGVAALLVHLNIGHRHLLPIYPALFVACGAAARAAAGSSVRLVAVALLVLWHVAGSLAVRPHYLAYFNPLAGGPREGYRHLVDSSLDWGQDLPGLRDWLARREAGARPAYLSYFGTASPAYYGIRAIPLPGWPERGPRAPTVLGAGTYCISATMLHALYGRAWSAWDPEREAEYQDLRARFGDGRWSTARPDATLDDPDERQLRNAYYQYEWLRFRRLTAYLRRREPDDRVGYSILVYELDERDLAEALEGPAPFERPGSTRPRSASTAAGREAPGRTAQNSSS